MILKQLYEPIQPELAMLEQQLAEVLRADEPRVQAVSNHILAMAGKRIRPALFFLCLKLWNEVILPFLPVALGIELVHSATLIHDDIIDQANFRRGQQTVHERWNNHTAVLSGDYLFARAFSLFCEFGEIEIIRRMAGVVSDMSTGEIQQQAEVFATDIDEGKYLQRIGKKTASFFQACCVMAGLALRLPQRELSFLEEFGYNFGMAFQIMDDVYDFANPRPGAGKPTGADLSQGVITLPVIHMLDNSAQSIYFKKRLSAKVVDAKLQKEILAEIEACGSLAYARGKAREYIGRGLDSLACLPPGQSRDSLEKLLLFVVED